eukprot:m.31559 g.31559  ORF g.31559 m.31559 type:complete len:806 (-) comp10695_c0_seq2:40-2457(-)
MNVVFIFCIAVFAAQMHNAVGQSQCSNITIAMLGETSKQPLHWSDQGTWAVGRPPCSCDSATISQPIFIESDAVATMQKLTLRRSTPLTLARGGVMRFSRATPARACPTIDSFDVIDLTATRYQATWSASPAENITLLVDGEEVQPANPNIWTGKRNLTNDELNFRLEVKGGAVTAVKNMTIKRIAPAIWKWRQDGNWTDETNWAENNVPCAGQHARTSLVKNSKPYEIVLNENATVRSFTLSRLSTLRLKPGVPLRITRSVEPPQCQIDHFATVFSTTPVPEDSTITTPTVSASLVSTSTTSSSRSQSSSSSTSRQSSSASNGPNGPTGSNSSPGSSGPTSATGTSGPTTPGGTGTGGTGGTGSTVTSTASSSTTDDDGTTTTSSNLPTDSAAASFNVVPVAGGAGAAVIILVLLLVVVIIRRRGKRVAVGKYDKLDMNLLDMHDAPFSSFYGPIKIAHHEGQQLWCYTLRPGPPSILSSCLNNDIMFYQKLQRGVLPNSILAAIHLDVARHTLVVPAPTVTLDERLRACRAPNNKQPESISYSERVRIGAQIASALTWLHKNNMVHSSPRASCVMLVGADPNWKLSCVEHDAIAIADGHPDGDFLLRWCAPELIGSPDSNHNPACDVWSFGILFWEILSLGATPYMNKQLKGTLKRGHHPPSVPTAPRDLFRVVKQCCIMPASARPKMVEVHQLCERAADAANTSPQTVDVSQYMPFIPSPRQGFQSNRVYLEPQMNSDGSMYSSVQETALPVHNWDMNTYDVTAKQGQWDPNTYDIQEAHRQEGVYAFASNDNAENPYDVTA